MDDLLIPSKTVIKGYTTIVVNSHSYQHHSLVIVQPKQFMVNEAPSNTYVIKLQRDGITYGYHVVMH